MKAYIKARAEVCSPQNIESAWRGAGLVPLNPKRALRSLDCYETPEPGTPTAPQEYDILNKVFLNSSPPDATVLQEANKLLNTAVKEVVNTPVRKYIQNLTSATEKLRAQNIIHQQDAVNLRAVLKARVTRRKGKRAVLKGHFHISTAELRDAVFEAEKDTLDRKRKKGKKKVTSVSHEPETEEELGEESGEGIETDTEDCIVVES